MTDNELLLAISQIMDKKLEPIKSELNKINLALENEIRPDIKLLAENYLPAAKRYENASNELDAMKTDIDILKKVVTEHSEKFQKIS